MQLKQGLGKLMAAYGALAAVGLTIFLWSSAFVGIRAALEEYTPGSLVLFRYLVASAVLLVYAMLTGMRLPEKRDLPAILLFGLLGFTVFNLGVSYGAVGVSAGSTSLLVGTAPIFTALLAAAFLKERLRVLGWLGICVSFIGAALISFGEGKGLHFEPRALLVLLAAASESVYFVMQKPYLRRYGPIEFTAYAVWAGTFFMLIFSPGLVGEVRNASLGATLTVVYLGVFPAVVAYASWTYALSRASASRVASSLYVMPVLTFLIGWWWLGEVPGSITVLGGVIALLGVVLANARKKGAEKTESLAAESVEQADHLLPGTRTTTHSETTGTPRR